MRSVQSEAARSRSEPPDEVEHDHEVGDAQPATSLASVMSAAA
jgi:hypothetical protein